MDNGKGKRSGRLSAAVLLTSVCLAAEGLPPKMAEVTEASPVAKQAFWGIHAVDAASGEPVAASGEHKFFVPASNTKLFTTSMALQRLGPDYRFRTRVETDRQPDSQGRVGELRLIGGADPNLSGRPLPYRTETDEESALHDPLAVLRRLADEVVAKGVREIAGDVVGDDTAFLWEPFPDGWSVDDPIYEYGAPVSALTINDNAFRLTVSPGPEAGLPASLSVQPAGEYLIVHNRTLTVEKGETKLNFDRVPGSRELIVTGTIALDAKPDTSLLAVDDPALFAAWIFRELLEERGVRITGDARAVHRLPDSDAEVWKGTPLAVHESAPLAQILQVVNKVSQNLHTELVLRETARVRTGTGSRRNGLKEIEAWLDEIGVEKGQYRFEDASGLSRLTLVTPATLTKLLVAMYRSPHREAWIATLPVGGVDGTLEKRFRGATGAERIRAKTGSISHVSSLSGYALRDDGGAVAFSILVNNYNAGHSAVRPLIDRIAMALLD